MRCSCLESALLIALVFLGLKSKGLYFLFLWSFLKFSFCFWCITIYTRAIALRTTRLKMKQTVNDINWYKKFYLHFGKFWGCSTSYFSNPETGELGFQLIELLCELFFVFGPQFRTFYLTLKTKSITYNIQIFINYIMKILTVKCSLSNGVTLIFEIKLQLTEILKIKIEIKSYHGCC